MMCLVDKSHHCIRISRVVRADLNTWLSFMSTYNGVTYFRALHLTDSKTINMVSDASKQGFGALYGSSWAQCAYPESWQTLHITILELYPIYVLITIFCHKLVNSNIIFECDNMAVTDIINKQSIKNSYVMKIVVLSSVHFNIGFYQDP